MEVTSSGQGQACATAFSVPVSGSVTIESPVGKDLQLIKGILSVLGRGSTDSRAFKELLAVY